MCGFVWVCVSVCVVANKPKSPRKKTPTSPRFPFRPAAQYSEIVTTDISRLLSSSDDTNSSRLQSLLVVRMPSLAAYESSSSGAAVPPLPVPLGPAPGCCCLERVYRPPPLGCASTAVARLPVFVVVCIATAAPPAPPAIPSDSPVPTGVVESGSTSSLNSGSSPLLLLALLFSSTSVV